MTLRRHIAAPRALVYRTMLDPKALASWKVPEGMRLHAHEFNPLQGGTLRISLTYDSPDAQGKSSAHTDTYRGRFAELVENERIVEVDEFESDDPALRGEMTITIQLRDAGDGGTELMITHENLPSTVSLADNETGWNMALDKLAALVERRSASAAIGSQL